MDVRIIYLKYVSIDCFYITSYSYLSHEILLTLMQTYKMSRIYPCLYINKGNDILIISHLYGGVKEVVCFMGSTHLNWLKCLIKIAVQINQILIQLC